MDCENTLADQISMLKPHDIHPNVEVKRVTNPKTGKKKQEIYLNNNWGEPAHLLTHGQLLALNSIRGEAKKFHIKYEKECVENYPHLPQIREWIAGAAPIEVRFPSDILNKLYQEPIYKNLFETKNGRGSENTLHRKTKENELFDIVYDYTDEIERPKYGALNYLNSSHGTLASRYGECYLQLKPEVKKRCTLTEGDSFSCNRYATFDFFNLMLHSRFKHEGKLIETLFTEDDIQNRKSRQYAHPSYMEVQIHGSLRLDRDVAAIFIPINLDDPNKALAKKIADKYGINLVFY